MEIIGSYVSPYVRKVLACLEVKGIDYAVDPITPFYGNDEFERLSPLRRIPVMIDGDVVLSDSSVICAYLDEAYPEPPLLPADPAGRARARWLEEFADTRLGDVFIWGLFYPKMVHPRVWGEEGDQERIADCLARQIPAALDYLESEVPGDGWLCGSFGLADISVASFFRNAAYADFTPDPARWPNIAAFVARTFALPLFEKLFAIEKVQLTVSIAERREALAKLGAKLTEKSYSNRTPQKGIMRL